MNLPLTEAFFLFISTPSENYEASEVKFLPSWLDIQLDFHASCGVITDLYLNGMISIVNGNVKYTENEISNIDYINDAIQAIKNDPEKSLPYWINYFSSIDYPKKQKVRFQIIDKINDHLEKEGLLTVKKSKYLLFFNSVITNSTEKGDNAKSEIIERLRKSISSGTISEYDLLLSLLLSDKYTDVLKSYLSPSEDELINKMLDAELFNGPNLKLRTIAESYIQGWNFRTP